jgi:hypothetical protein
MLIHTASIDSHPVIRINSVVIGRFIFTEVIQALSIYRITAAAAAAYPLKRGWPGAEDANALNIRYIP